MWAIVPVKRLAEAKQRLSALLSTEQRAALGLAMLEDVLAALSGVAALDGILLVSPDPRAHALGRRYGARILAEAENHGLNPAVQRAAALLQAEGVAQILVLHGDLPLVTEQEISRLIAAHRLTPALTPALTIAPDAQGRGTNAMICSPPDLVDFHYGPDSVRAHCAAAEQAGVVPTLPRAEGLGFDIDEVGDLLALTAHPATTCTRKWLSGQPLAAMQAACTQEKAGVS